jgi:hypothetical protein
MRTVVLVLESVSRYVWDLARTPNFDEALPFGFERALSAANWTLPAVCSMVSGVYPDVHGARRDGDTYDYDGADLFRLMQLSGHKTFLFSAVPYSISIGRGVSDRRIYHLPVGNTYAYFEEMLKDSAKYWGKEFFGLFHLGETHQPYEVVGMRRGVRPWKIMDRQIERAKAKYPGRVGLPVGQERHELVSAIAEAVLWQVYALHWVDAAAKPLLELPDCRVVVVADHGENWDPRYNLGHGFTYSLKPDALRVPLVTNMEPLGALDKITSTKEVFRICMGEELEQGSAEAFFYGHRGQGVLATSNNPCIMDDNRVLIDDRGWHYVRRFDELTPGSTVPEGEIGFNDIWNEVLQRVKKFSGVFAK